MYYAFPNTALTVLLIEKIGTCTCNELVDKTYVAGYLD